MTIIQTNKSRTSVALPGGGLGPGSYGILSATCSLPSVTTGNSILAFVSARIRQSGSEIFLGPSPGTGSAAGGTGGLTYYVLATYVLDDGTETPTGGEAIQVVPSGQSLDVAVPRNYNLGGGLTGVVGWNVYIGLTAGSETKQNSSPIALATDWVTDGVTISGTTPPASPIHDSTGNNYQTCYWTDGIYHGTANGEEAMGVFLSPSVAGGSTVFRFIGFAHNGNPIFGFDVDIDIILFEVAGFSDATVLDADAFKQSTNVGTVDVDLTGVGGRLLATHYPIMTNNAVTVIDFESAGADVTFTMLTGDHTGSPVPGYPGGTLPIPTLNTGIYKLLDGYLDESTGFPLYVWVNGLRKSRPQYFVVL